MISSHLSIFALLFLFLSLASLSLSLPERCNTNDKKALLQIKKDLNNPYDIIIWDSKTDCCKNWYGVKCDDIANRTIKLAISQANLLHLPIPAAVGDLPFLQGLTFHVCNVTGQIPQAISKLSNLDFLDLSQNLLTGPVPSFLGNLTKLTEILLSRNSLTGATPASLSQLPSLRGLFLDRNKLTGGLPESFGDFKDKQIYLYLSHNNLSGKIPASLGNVDFDLFDV